MRERATSPVAAIYTVISGLQRRYKGLIVHRTFAS